MRKNDKSGPHPGPWYLVLGDDEYIVLNVPPGSWVNDPLAFDREEMARLVRADFETEEQFHATARLISEAPNLLRALNSFVDRYADGRDTPTTIEWRFIHRTLDRINGRIPVLHDDHDPDRPWLKCGVSNDYSVQTCVRPAGHSGPCRTKGYENQHEGRSWEEWMSERGVAVTSPKIKCGEYPEEG